MVMRRSEHGVLERPADQRDASTPAHRGRRGRRKRRDGTGQASFGSSIINLVNTIVGAGILAMPSALAQMGMVLGTVMIIWSGITSGFGLYLQTKAARYLERGQSSFFALSQLTYPNAAIIFDGAIAIKCFGVGVSYLIILGDLMPGVVLGFSPGVKSIGILVDRHFWVTAFMLIVIPLSFLRRLDSLKYTSIIALVAIGYVIILILVHFIKRDTLQDRGDVNIIKWEGPIEAFSSFPIIVFAYTCHQNMFSILNEIKNDSHFRTTMVVVCSIGSACLMYILVAITGYLSYGSNVIGNIVSQYPPAVPSTIGRLAIVILVVFSYPLQVHPCRASVDAVLRWRPIRKSSNRPGTSASSSSGGVMGSTSITGSSSSGTSTPVPATMTASHLSLDPLTRPFVPPAGPTTEMPDLRFALLTSAILVLSYVVAMTVENLEHVLAYVGATGSTAISFILPGLFYHRISDPKSKHARRRRKNDDEGSESSDDDFDSDEDAPRAAGDQDDTDDEGIPPAEQATRGLLVRPRRWMKRRLRAARRVSGPRARWRRGLLRRLSLALAIYGGAVMVVCLALNTYKLFRKEGGKGRGPGDVGS